MLCWEGSVCIDKNNFLNALFVVPPSLMCSDERDFERKAVFNLTLSCIYGMHQHKSNNEISLLFNQYLRQSTKTEKSTSFEFQRLCLYPWKERNIFHFHLSLYVLTSNFLVEFYAIKPLRFIRNRPLSFAHTVCCIDFFLFLNP